MTNGTFYSPLFSIVFSVWWFSILVLLFEHLLQQMVGAVEFLQLLFHRLQNCTVIIFVLSLCLFFSFYEVATNTVSYTKSSSFEPRRKYGDGYVINKLDFYEAPRRGWSINAKMEQIMNVWIATYLRGTKNRGRYFVDFLLYVPFELSTPSSFHTNLNNIFK